MSFQHITPWVFISRIHKPIDSSEDFSTCSVRHAHIFGPFALRLKYGHTLTHDFDIWAALPSCSHERSRGRTSPGD